MPDYGVIQPAPDEDGKSTLAVQSDYGSTPANHTGEAGFNGGSRMSPETYNAADNWTGPDANYLDTLAAQQQTRGAYAASDQFSAPDRAQSQALAGQQQNALGMYLAQANGTNANSAAAIQGQQGMDAANRAAMLQTGGTRGGDAMNQARALQGGGALGSQAAQASGIARAQEQAAGQSAYGQQLGQMQSQGLAQQGTDAQSAEWMAQQQAANRAQNDKASLAYAGLGNDAASAVQQGQENYWGNLANYQVQNTNEKQTGSQSNTQNTIAMTGAGLKMVGQVAALSDATAKDDIQPMGAADHPYGYEQGDGYGYDLPTQKGRR